MTTIAYRDGIVAADTLCRDDEFAQKYYRRKIRVMQDAVIAESGEDRWIDAFCAWWKGGRLHPAPRIPKGQIGMLVVYRDLRVELWADAVYGLPISEDYCATGSGGAVALGAMWMGASAGQAVRAAMAHDNDTGGRVTTVDVRKALKARRR